jgi:lysophospholipase L1-like esterase
LERLFRERLPERNVQVFNRGVRCVTTFEVLRHFEGNLRLVRPHLTVLQLGVNSAGPTGIFGLARAGESASWTDALNASKTLRTLRLLVSTLAAAFRGHLHVQRIYSDIYLTSMGELSPAYRPEEQRRYIEKLVDMARARGSDVLLCGYFDSHANEVLRDVAESRRAFFCDVSGEYRKRLEQGRASELLSEDGWHPNAAGYAVIAERLFEAISRTAAADLRPPA